MEGFGHVKIVVSGGLNPERIRYFKEAGAPVDSYAVGSYISGATPIDFTGDIKEIDGRPIAKRGRIPGLTAVAAPAAGRPVALAGRLGPASRSGAFRAPPFGARTARRRPRVRAYELLQRGHVPAQERRQLRGRGHRPRIAMRSSHAELSRGTRVRQPWTSRPSSSMESLIGRPTRYPRASAVIGPAPSARCGRGSRVDRRADCAGTMSPASRSSLS